MPRPLQINSTTSVGRASLILALMIGVSRLTGFGRLIVASYFFGRGPATAAYVAAFNIPDTLAILISGGLLATGFVPVFTRYLSAGETERAQRTFRALLTLMMVGFGGVTLFLFVLTFTPFGTLLAPDKVAPKFVGLYLHILRILLAAQFLFVVGGVFAGTFNALRLFWFQALQPVFYNCGVIVFGILGAKAGIEWQAWGALAGAFCGTVLMFVPAALRHGLSLRPLLDARDEGVRRVASSFAPIVLGLASGQIIALNLPRAFAKWLPSTAFASLDSANRLMQVPLDLLASSVAVALFPTLSRLFIEGDDAELRTSFDAALARINGAMLFAAAMLLVLAHPLVALLLEHGSFGAQDARETAFVLQCYALCLPALGAQQLLARGFFATDRAREPVWIGLGAMALFLVLGGVATQFPLAGGASLALAAAVSTSVLSLLLWRSLQKHLNLDGAAAIRALGRGALVALGAGIAAGLAVLVVGGLVAKFGFDTDLAPQGVKLVARALVVAVGGGAGVGVWLTASRKFGPGK